MGFKQPLTSGEPSFFGLKGIHDSLRFVHHGHILTIHHKLHSLRESPSVSSFFQVSKFLMKIFVIMHHFSESPIRREIQCYDKIEMKIMVSKLSSLTTRSTTKTVLFCMRNSINQT